MRPFERCLARILLIIVKTTKHHRQLCGSRRGGQLLRFGLDGVLAIPRNVTSSPQRTPSRTPLCASHNEMIGSTLHLVGKDAKTGSVRRKRALLAVQALYPQRRNQNVIVHRPRKYEIIDVSSYTENDDSLSGNFGY